MSTHIVITGCSDQRMWYAGMVGQLVELVRDLPSEHCYLSREHSGYTNIVRHADASTVPAGHVAAEQHTVAQQHDLILTNGQWQLATLEQLGTTVVGRIVIRRPAP
jgi:hypothetical protein